MTRCGHTECPRTLADILHGWLQEISEKARELVRLAICTEGGRKTLKREDINKKGQQKLLRRVLGERDLN